MSDDEDTLAGRVREHDVAALADYLALKSQAAVGLHRTRAGHGPAPQDRSRRHLPGSQRRGGPLAGGNRVRPPRRLLLAVPTGRAADHRCPPPLLRRAETRRRPRSAPGQPRRRHPARRHHRPVGRVDDHGHASPLAQPERAAPAGRALGKLPAEQREALRLRYVENLPSKEIAARLGKSDGAVRVMLTRALGQLQQLLGPENAPR